MPGQPKLHEAFRPFIVERMECFARKYLDRQIFLDKQGWTATKPSIEWLQSFGNEDDWSEYLNALQAWKIEKLTLGLVRDPGSTSINDTKLLQKRYDAERADRVGFLSRRGKMMRAVRACYEEEKFPKLRGYCESFDPDKKTARYSLYKRVMTEELEPLGFTKSKELSTSGRAIYAQKINDYWSIAFDVDKGNLGGIPAGNEFSLRLRYGLVHYLNRGITPEHPYTIVENSYFYPIGFAANVYNNGDGLSDLELFLLAHLDMYKNIHDDLRSIWIGLLEDSSYIDYQ